jgi:hypothetical protein
MMKEKTADWLIMLSKIASWVLSVLAIYWIILKLTNHSPTTD